MTTTTLQTSTEFREEISRNLGLLLANTYVLYVKTQNFHWNVKGPRFQQLHALFESHYTALATAIDEIAEQIRILQETPPSSMKEFLDLASIEESASELSENEMLATLLSDHETIISQLAGGIELAQKNKDEGTADLLIGRSRKHLKIAWMLRSHLENTGP